MSKTERSIAAVPQETDLTMFEGEVGDYYEGIDAGAFSMPFLSLLQGLSPQVQRGNPAYIQGAAPGMVLNVLTSKLYDLDKQSPNYSPLLVSVVRRSHTLCWWTPRDKGGGWLGECVADVEALQRFEALPRDEKKRAIDKDGYEWTEHRNFFCRVIASEHAREPAFISLTKSQLKPARDWNSLIDLHSIRVPARKPDGEAVTDAAGRPVLVPNMASEVWRIGTKLRTKGENSWFMWTIEHLGRHSVPAIFADVRAAIASTKEIKLLARPAPDDATEEGSSGEM